MNSMPRSPDAWPEALARLLAYYEAEHRQADNRVIHHVAHSLAAVGAVVAIRRPAAGIACIVAALPVSWLGHLVFERNTPAFFDTSGGGGIGGGGVAKKGAVAIGGVIWSAACALRVFGLGPLSARGPAARRRDAVGGGVAHADIRGVAQPSRRSEVTTVSDAGIR